MCISVSMLYLPEVTKMADERDLFLHMKKWEKSKACLFIPMEWLLFVHHLKYPGRRNSTDEMPPSDWSWRMSWDIFLTDN